MCDPECGPLAAGVSSSSLGICLFMGMDVAPEMEKRAEWATLARAVHCSIIHPIQTVEEQTKLVLMVGLRVKICTPKWE